jgi:hypothetical protein
MLLVGKWVSHLLPLVIPIAAKWVEREERRILFNGVPLDQRGLRDAAKMGVGNPERIRLMKVDHIPLLNSGFIRILSRMIPTISCNTVGVSLGYGIYIRSKYWGNRHLIAHECVHSGQYERYGNHSRFLHAYFSQCLVSGYPDAPLEQEAILRSAELDGPD